MREESSTISDMLRASSCRSQQGLLLFSLRIINFEQKSMHLISIHYGGQGRSACFCSHPCEKTIKDWARVIVLDLGKIETVYKVD